MEEFERSHPESAREIPPLSAAEVFEVWLCLARADRPWRAMYLDDVAGGLRRVLKELLDERHDLDGAARRRRLHAAARAHGVFRRRQACAPQILGLELRVVDEAIRDVLLESGAPAELVRDTLVALATEMRSVGRAAHAGYLDRSP